MNSFEVKKIEKTKPGRWIKHHLILTIIALVLGFLTIKGVVGAISSGAPISVKQIVLSAVSRGLDKDLHGNTNILLIGIGGEGHDGENLTDTMILASIDYSNDVVSMLSIPRDLFVENEAVGWGTRINSIYELILDKTDNHEQAIGILKTEVEEVLGLEIQHYAKIDFKGFTEVVDALGGVEINIEEDFYDPYYPAPDGSTVYYDPFIIKAGLQVLDGDTALKYARSRKTSSDFDRAKRQQEILVAMKEQALQIGFLLNPIKLKKLYFAISENFETDLSLSEMTYLAKIADDFSRESIIHHVISDETYNPGGFLYTPERELYGGAFVLIPVANDYSEIHKFAELFLFNSGILASKIPVTVLNGTHSNGLATDIKLYLNRYGFNVLESTNAESKDLTDSVVYYKGLFDGSEETASKIAEMLGIEATLKKADAVEEIVIELGSDFLDFYEENAKLFYSAYYYY